MKHSFALTQATHAPTGTPFIFKTLLFILIFSLSACGGGSKGSSNTLDLMDVNLSVIDVYGAPIEGASVNVLAGTSGNTVDFTTSQNATNVLGNIIVQDIPEQTRFQFQLNKIGFATQVHVFTTPEDDQPASITITMIQREAPVSFSVDTKADISGKDGAKLKVAENAFVDANGNAISGDIELSMTPIDISTPAGLAAFPGSFTGIPDDGSEAAMIVSLGTTEFRFTQNGEEINLAPGQTATIELPMYTKLHLDGSEVKPGDTIPLWYLNESTGLWQQEGTGTVVINIATPTGLAMRAEVSHFSFWNVDHLARDQRGTINISFKLTENDELVDIPDTFDDQIQVYAITSGFGLTNRYTRMSDVFSAEIPANQEICSFATYFYGESIETANLIGTEEVCVTVQGGGSLNIELEFKIEPFNVEVNVPDSATIGTQIGACGIQYFAKGKNFIPPAIYSISSGALPAGILLSSTGLIYGAPTTVIPGSSNPAQFKVRLEDSLGRTVETDTVTIQIFDELSLDTIGLVPILNVDQPTLIQKMFQGDGGKQPLTYRAVAMPPGMDVDNATGDVSGIPQAIIGAGIPALYYDSMASVQVEDQNCASVKADISQGVIYHPKLEGNPPSSAIVDLSFSFTPVNTGGPIESRRVEGLPPWANFDINTGTISGTPKSQDVGHYIIKLIAEHGYGDPTSGLGYSELEFELNVIEAAPDLLGIANTQVAIGQSLTIQPSNIGGVATSWSIQNKPSWMAFNNQTGELSGTATTAAIDSNINITATNAEGSSDTGGFNIAAVAFVVAPQLAGSPASAQVGVNYNFAVTNAGGQVTNWAALIGTLPIGLSYANGIISGRPTMAGSYSGLQIAGSNTAGNGSLNVTLVVNKGPQASLQFSNPSPVTRNLGTAGLTNKAIGGSGAGAILYSTSNSAVATVDINSGQVTLVSIGQASITATKAADANYLSASTRYLLDVTSSIIMLSGIPAPSIDAGFAYNFTPVITQGVVHNWSVSNLPTWANFQNSNGEITGTPNISQVQTYTGITITASNNFGASSSIGPFLIDVTMGKPALSGIPNAIFPVLQGTLNTFLFEPVNLGGAAVSWEIFNLPSWAGFNTTTGVLKGSMTCADGTHGEVFDNITIRAINASGFSDIGPFSITTDLAATPPQITLFIPTREAYPGKTYISNIYTNQCEKINAMLNGPAPDWLKVDEGVNKLTGIPSLNDYPATYRDLSITFTNSAGSTTSALFDIEVSLPETERPEVYATPQGAIVKWAVNSLMAPTEYTLYIAEQAGAYNDSTTILEQVTVSPPLSRHEFTGLNAGQEYFFTIGAVYTDNKGGRVELRSHDVAFVPSPINDTGIIGCGSATVNSVNSVNSCPNLNHPNQDAEIGRDKQIKNYQLGFNYTPLDSFGSPLLGTNGIPVQHSFGATCIKDETTGLVWEIKDPNTGSLNNKNIAYNYSEALEFVDSMNALDSGVGFCGRNNWRLPETLELHSLVNLSTNAPTILNTFFPNTLSANYWTGTPFNSDINDAWVVKFSFGNLQGGWNKTSTNMVRLVSGTPLSSVLSDDNNGMIKQESTGLIWKKCVEGMTYDANNNLCTGTASTYTWSEALQEVALVNAGDVSENLLQNDWRAPNIKEIIWHANYFENSPAIDTSLFPSAPNTNLWSNTPGKSNNPTSAWMFDSNSGGTNLETKTTTGALRLVRGGTPSSIWFQDIDNDTYGNPLQFIYSVLKPVGYTHKNNDCDDNNNTTSPLASEIPNDEVDNNCNGIIDEAFSNGDDGMF